LCESDGSNPVQLTDFKAHTSSPEWSPDGRRLVFDSIEKGDWNLYVVDADGGSLRRLTQQGFDESIPSFSRNGRWIYFQSDRSGRLQIWKMPADGGAGVQLTDDGGCWPEESWDGRFIYYSKDINQPSAVWRVPVDGGEETEIIRERIAAGHWTVGKNGIYFFRLPPPLGEQARDWSIQYLDLHSRQVSELFRKSGPFDHWSLEVSPDEQWILYGERPVGTSELMLLENFR
jgi:dipeptidyl aminopeptidase/acylaminoacyl peptidase